MTIDSLKVLIVDDNDAYRDFLVEVVDAIEGAEVVGTAYNGRVALIRLKQLPVDLVLMDIEMPLMDGLEALDKIRELYPEVGVVMVSAFYQDGADKVIKALEMGALDFVSKGGMGENHGSVVALRRRLITLMGLFRARRQARLTRRMAGEPASRSRASVNVKSEEPGTEAHETGSIVETVRPALTQLRPLMGHTRVEAVAIGVSTGGPNALARIIPQLPADLGVPVFLVQHMPADLTASLADSLDKKSMICVREAADRMEVVSNTVYLAPGGKHMIVTRSRNPSAPPAARWIRLLNDPPVNSCRPSVDVLFSSIAEVYEGAILAVVMTGMGSDGAEGVRLLKRKSCYCMTQTEDTCVVYGMPRVVDEAGLSDERVTLEQMADRIVEHTRGRR